MKESLENLSRREFLRSGASIGTSFAIGQPLFAQDDVIDLKQYFQKDLKIAAPAPGDVSAAIKVARDVLKSEYDAAKKDSDAKLALAQRLFTDAETEKNDIGRFALLCEARDTAASIKDLDMVYSAVDKLMSIYDVPATVAIGDELYKQRLQKDELAVLVDKHLTLAERAIADNDYESAKEIADYAHKKARYVSRDESKRAKRLVDSISVLKAEYEFAKPPESEVALSVKPNDPKINHAIGSYLCFVKDAWDPGLKFLAKSGNSSVSKAAEFESKGPDSDETQFEAGELWYEASKKARRASFEQERYIDRARYWFETAYANSSGLIRSHIEKKLSSLPAPSVSPSLQVITASEFDRMSSLYNSTNDLAKTGKATSSSVYGNRDPQRVFSGNRKAASWSLNGPDGWFEAQWPAPVLGRYLLIFGPPFPVGNDPWGKSKLNVNNSIEFRMNDMTSSKVAIIDLKRLTPIHKLRIDIDSDQKWYPGISSLEIYSKLEKR